MLSIPTLYNNTTAGTEMVPWPAMINSHLLELDWETNVQKFIYIAISTQQFII